MTTIIPLPKLHPYIFSSLMRNKLCTSKLSSKAMRSLPTIMNVAITNNVEVKAQRKAHKIGKIHPMNYESFWISHTNMNNGELVATLIDDVTFFICNQFDLFNKEENDYLKKTLAKSKIFMLHVFNIDSDRPNASIKACILYNTSS